MTRRKFLTGLGLGGVVIATPPVARAFLDVGKATREGEVRFRLKPPRKFVPQWSAAEKAQLKLDLAAHVPGDEDEWWKVREEYRVALGVSYRDTYIDQENGDIWTVNPQTNIATKAAAGTRRAHLSSSLLKAYA